MNNKLIVEISEGLGNQIFMYAHAYSLSRELDYALFIDNKSGYSKKKNLLRIMIRKIQDILNLNILALLC